MLYLYDNAIVDDLKNIFNTDAVSNPVVSVFAGEEVEGVAAMLQNDEISLPIICLTRGDPQKDSDRSNFTWMHKGVATVMDHERHELYYEKRIPIKFSYTMCIYGSNQAMMDEITRELIFHYTEMFFLPIKLPYEDSKIIRFGIQLPDDMEIVSKSGVSDYVESGKLYESDIQLDILGAFLVTYTPVKLKRMELGVEAE